jgi:hypothetical protein
MSKPSSPLRASIDRLHTTPKWIPKEEKGADDSLVCDLPSSTLRWMKQRRKSDSHQKVVLSYQRDRQLREMFNSLDYTNQGEIDLTSLTDAVDYVVEKTKHMKGMEQFRNLHDIFVGMDDNGDGTIDFQEFTNGMTGTTQSAFDKATDYDIERLFKFFVEFGELRQRKIALKIININPVPKRNLHNSQSQDDQTRPSTSATDKGNSAGGGTGEGEKTKFTRGYSMSSKITREKTENKKNDLDLSAYQQFKILFGNVKDSKSSFATSTSSSSQSATNRPQTNTSTNISGIRLNSLANNSSEIRAPGSRPFSGNPATNNNHNNSMEIDPRPLSLKVEIIKLQKIEKMLDDFVIDNLFKQEQRTNGRRQRHTHYPQDFSVSLISSGLDGGTGITEESRKTEFDLKRREYLEIHAKLKERRKEEYELFSKHHKDAIFMEQRARHEKK